MYTIMALSSMAFQQRVLHTVGYFMNRSSTPYRATLSNSGFRRLFSTVGSFETLVLDLGPTGLRITEGSNMRTNILPPVVFAELTVVLPNPLLWRFESNAFHERSAFLTAGMCK